MLIERITLTATTLLLQQTEHSPRIHATELLAQTPTLG
jgi:hypothetical protein